MYQKAKRSFKIIKTLKRYHAILKYQKTLRHITLVLQNITQKATTLGITLILSTSSAITLMGILNNLEVKWTSISKMI